MANTVTKSGQVVSVVFDGSSAFSLATELGAAAAGVRLRKLGFYPAATNDVITVREGAATGPVLAKLKDVTGVGRDLDFPGLRCFPYVVGNEAPANSVLIFLFE